MGYNLIGWLVGYFKKKTPKSGWNIFEYYMG